MMMIFGERGRERESKVKVKGIMPKLKNIVAQNNKTREWPFALLRALDIRIIY